MVDFDDKLMKAETSEEVRNLKLWMFQERVKIQAKKDELNELSLKLQEEKRTLERDRNALNMKIKAENKRFNDNEKFMSQKQKIIEDAFRQLALDKKTLECERLNFEYEKGKYVRQRFNARKNSYDNDSFDSSSYTGCIFFQGVDSELALRKRYKELLKIFHPDNKCGDTRTLLLIQKEYEKIKRQYYEA